jgi:hypothetical protein
VLDSRRTPVERKFRRIRGYQEILLLNERLNHRVFSKGRRGPQKSLEPGCREHYRAKH